MSDIHIFGAHQAKVHIFLLKLQVNEEMEQNFGTVQILRA